MPKATHLIALLVLSILSISANTERVFKAADGFKAPQFTLKNNESTLTLGSLKGEYVLVCFWSTADANSRIAVADYDRYLSSADSKARLVGVNLDSSSELFSAVVEADALNTATQYHADGDDAERLIRDYALQDDMMKTYLIDPTGSIVATNPSLQLLESI